VVVSDALDFLRTRGHDTETLTDYEIQDAFEAAFKNWQHGLVEAAFYTGLPWIAKPRDWKKYCDDLHRAIEDGGRHSRRSDVAERLLSAFREQGVPAN
jgi:hypothetical protein